MFCVVIGIRCTKVRKISETRAPKGNLYALDRRAEGTHTASRPAPGAGCRRKKPRKSGPAGTDGRESRRGKRTAERGHHRSADAGCCRRLKGRRELKGGFSQKGRPESEGATGTGGGGDGTGGVTGTGRCIIGKTKCDEIKNEMRPSWRKAWSKRNATKISHTRKNTVRTTTKRCSNGIFLSQKQRSLRSLLVIANHPLLLSTTTRFRGTDGPLDAVDDPPVALGVSVDHIERKHRQHKLSLHCLE